MVVTTFSFWSSIVYRPSVAGIPSCAVRRASSGRCELHGRLHFQVATSSVFRCIFRLLEALPYVCVRRNLVTAVRGTAC